MAPTRTRIRVRYAEVDRMGVVHHSRYFVYLEIARTESLRATGLSYRQVEDAGVYLVITHARCRFRAPARYDDEIVIESRITRATAVRIDHDYTITKADDDTLIAEAQTTLACVDRQGTLTPMPDTLLQRLHPAP